MMNSSLQSRLVRIAATTIAATRLWRVLLLLLLVAISTLAVMPLPPAGIDFVWDKLNHALAFAALAFAAGLGFPTPRASRFGASLALLAYGGLLELLQLSVPQRSAEWADLLADGLGIACGVLIATVVLRAAARLSSARR
jgi:VanZ family protein